MRCHNRCRTAGVNRNTTKYIFEEVNRLRSSFDRLMSVHDRGFKEKNEGLKDILSRIRVLHSHAMNVVDQVQVRTLPLIVSSIMHLQSQVVHSLEDVQELEKKA